MRRPRPILIRRPPASDPLPTPFRRSVRPSSDPPLLASLAHGRQPVRSHARDGGRVMITLSNENVVTLCRAAEHFPRRRGNRRPHASTLYRWAARGVRSDGGEVVRL